MDRTLSDLQKSMDANHHDVAERLESERLISLRLGNRSHANRCATASRKIRAQQGEPLAKSLGDDQGEVERLRRELADERTKNERLRGQVLRLQALHQFTKKPSKIDPQQLEDARVMWHGLQDGIISNAEASAILDAAKSPEEGRTALVTEIKCRRTASGGTNTKGSTSSKRSTETKYDKQMRKSLSQFAEVADSIASK